MSNHLAIAVVTATLHELVQAAVSEAVPGVTVRIGPPRAVLSSESEVSLYLYHLTPNAQLRNSALPTRRHDGVQVAPTRVALDLHYMIAFSGESQLATETMLGSVLLVMESLPVLTGEEIRRVIRASGAYSYLKDSDLPEDKHQVKLTPEYPTFEEMTKLWSVFFQIAQRPSLQYLASPVVLDSGPKVTPPPPSERRLLVRHNDGREELAAEPPPGRRHGS